MLALRARYYIRNRSITIARSRLEKKDPLRVCLYTTSLKAALEVVLAIFDPLRPICFRMRPLEYAVDETEVSLGFETRLQIRPPQVHRQVATLRITTICTREGLSDIVNNIVPHTSTNLRMGTRSNSLVKITIGMPVAVVVAAPSRFHQGVALLIWRVLFFHRPLLSTLLLQPTLVVPV